VSWYSPVAGLVLLLKLAKLVLDQRAFQGVTDEGRPGQVELLHGRINSREQLIVNRHLYGLHRARSSIHVDNYPHSST